MNVKLIIVGAFLIVAGLGGLLINFGETLIDAVVVILGGIAIYLGKEV